MAKTKTTKPKLAATQDNVAPTQHGYTNNNTNVTPLPELTMGEQLSINLSPEAIKTLTLLASAILFAAPAFATQANPQNIVALGDMFYRYAIGSILVNQPSDAVANVPAIPNTPAGAQAPTFG